MDPASDAAKQEAIERKLAQARRKPCPNPACSGSRAELVKIDGRWHMKCPYCKMAGPGSFVREHAADAWMRLPRRPEPAKAPDPARTCAIPWRRGESPDGIWVYEWICGDCADCADKDATVGDCTDKLGLKPYGDLPAPETVKRPTGDPK